MSCADTVTQLDLPVDDLSASVAFFRRILALPVREGDHRDPEVRLAPDLTVRLHPCPDHRRTRPGDRPGPVLQIEVPDLHRALAELRRRGATVLIEPVLTEWSTMSAFVAGPGDLIVEFYRPCSA